MLREPQHQAVPAASGLWEKPGFKDAGFTLMRQADGIVYVWLNHALITAPVERRQRLCIRKS